MSGATETCVGQLATSSTMRDMAATFEAALSNATVAMDTMRAEISRLRVTTAAQTNNLTSITTRLSAAEDDLEEHCGRHCYPGEYVSTPCADGQNTVCSGCPSETCTTSLFPRHLYTLRPPPPPTPHPHPRLLEQYLPPAPPRLKLTLRLSLPDSCRPSAQSDSPGGLVRGCSNCTACNTRLTITSAACSASADTLCEPCPICPAGKYAAGTCSGTGTGHCRNHTSCGDNQIVSARGTAQADIQCTNCTSCGSGFYVRQECTATTQTVCARCTVW